MKYPDKETELYMRKNFTIAEKIYEHYINIRRELSYMEKMKYDIKDDYILNEDYKQGFLAGIKVMMSIYMDM